MDFQKQAQDFYSKAPLIVLGSGASAAYGMSGMGALADHLIAKTNIAGLIGADLDAWSKFCAVLNAGVGLEEALHQVNVSAHLTSRIIDATWTQLSLEDIEIFNRCLQMPKMFPLSRLLDHMFKSSLKKINIITTNYDRLAEYACDQANLHHYSGFTHGAFRQLSAPDQITCKRTVNIWKVHGSLDWFKSPLEDVVALPIMGSIPENYEPHIVTPGTQKYQRTHLEPYRSIIQHADEAITAAESYLCVGYGFNDEHLQPKLIEKCVRKNVPITIVTYALSPAVRQLIEDGKLQNFLAIERGATNDESIIYSSLSKESILVDQNIWSLEGYLSLIM